jgi:EAL domain-containing protein (putative c-di-GMP-specific phosphodiesterase class I)
LSASIGIALSSRVSTTAVTLLRDADAAMYAAKARGGNRVEIFDEAVGARVRRRVHLEGELRRAIPAGQLRLHYQPIVELVGRRVAGLEALVRWQHPDRGLLLPGDFIPLAEESGLILELGAWVMDQAVAKAAAERRQVPAAPVTWVNLSAAQLHDNSFPDLVRRSLSRHGVPGSALGLEITESMLVDDLARTTKVLQDFRDVGIRCAIDDFGTGYSSLSYLARFPVDTVKIDQGFVAGLEAESTRRESYAIINAVVGLARALKLDLVAEGIETPSQAEALHGLGCDYGQGYLLGRPAPR